MVKKSQNSRFADKSGTPVPNPAEFFLIRKIPVLCSEFNAGSNEPIIDSHRAAAEDKQELLNDMLKVSYPSSTDNREVIQEVEKSF